MQNIMHIYVLNDTLNMSFKILIASLIDWEFWALAHRPPPPPPREGADVSPNEPFLKVDPKF